MIAYEDFVPLVMRRHSEHVVLHLVRTRSALWPHKCKLSLRQVQQAVSLNAVMRLFWCYGSERFWNYCGRMISDRGHPLENFIKGINIRKSADAIPTRFVSELAAHVAQHNLSNLVDTVDKLRASTPGRTVAHTPAQLLARARATNVPFQAPPGTLDHVLHQLKHDWGAEINHTYRTRPHLTSFELI